MSVDWLGPRATFCRRCGAKMKEMVVQIRAEYHPQTGERGADVERRWDCPQGVYAATMGYDGAHSSPDMEIVG